MPEEPKKDGAPEAPESLEKRMERLRPVFEESFSIYNSERRLEEGALTVTRRRQNGKVETISGLVVVEIDKDGPCFSGIDERGNPTDGATMLWKEILDAKSDSLPTE